MIEIIVLALITFILCLSLIGGTIAFFMDGFNRNEVLTYCIVLYIVIVFLKILFTGGITLY